MAGRRTRPGGEVIRRPPPLEKHLLQAVLDLAKIRGLVTAHFRPARVIAGRTVDPDGAERVVDGWRTAVQGDGKGFVDLVLVGGRGLLHRELKRDGENPTAAQQRWIDVINAAGGDAGVWRNADLASGRIDAEMRALGRVAVTRPFTFPR